MTEVTAAVAQGLGPPRRQFSGVHGVEGSLGGCSGARQGQSLCGGLLRRAGRGLRSCRPRSDGELSASPSPQSPGVGGRSWKSRRGVSSAWAGCHAEPACHGDLRTGQRPDAGAGRPGWRPASCTQPSTTEQWCAVTSGSRGPASRTAHRPVLEGTPPQALLSPPLSPAESVLPPRLASRSSRSVFSVGTASGR